MQIFRCLSGPTSIASSFGWISSASRMISTRFRLVNGDGKITGVVVLVVKETKVLQHTPLDAMILIFFLK